MLLHFCPLLTQRYDAVWEAWRKASYLIAVSAAPLGDLLISISPTVPASVVPSRCDFMRCGSGASRVSTPPGRRRARRCMTSLVRNMLSSNRGRPFLTCDSRYSDFAPGGNKRLCRPKTSLRCGRGPTYYFSVGKHYLERLGTGGNRPCSSRLSWCHSKYQQHG